MLSVRSLDGFEENILVTVTELEFVCQTSTVFFCREMVLADKGNSHVWRFSPDLIFLTIYSSHFVGTRRGILPPKSISSVCNSIFFLKMNSLLLQSRISQSVHARNIKR